MPYPNQQDSRENRGHQTHKRQEPIASQKVIGDRKTFFVDLHENDRGMMVKLKELVNDRRNMVIIGAEDLDRVILALQEIQKEVRARL